jgi:LacI family transcriptional regulator
MLKRVTMRQVAERAGVHSTTVSLALRNHASLPEATRLRLQKLAQEMGYRPDPMLNALMVYRSQNKKPGYRATLAWVSNHFTRRGWAKVSTFDLYHQGARQRATQLGYELEEFWLREPGLTPERATSILTSRGISGLILVPQPRPKMRVRLDWNLFSAVSFGFSIASPQLHVVTNDQFHAMTAVIRRMRIHGYRRIGLVLNLSDDERSNHRWTGAYLAHAQHWPAENHIPIFFQDDPMSSDFPAWIDNYRPEAIISYANLTARIQALGLRVPQDVGFATYSTTLDNFVSGIDENPFLTGSAAVDLVVGMIQRGEQGIPPVRQCVLVEGTWNEGGSLNFKNRPSPSSRNVAVSPG